jgi:hypothetical protein
VVGQAVHLLGQAVRGEPFESLDDPCVEHPAPLQQRLGLGIDPVQVFEDQQQRFGPGFRAADV